MIDAFKFQIECVSPTINLGAEKLPEHEIFRAASLRGCWRFWARAAIAGAMETPQQPDKLRLLESCLFGGTEPAFQAFRMRVIPPLCASPENATFLILPHKHQGQKTGSPPGSRAEVRISLNQTVYAADQARKALLAAIWLWGNLGGIGTRSRRGFGSVALLPDADGHDLFAAAGLPLCCKSFPDRAALIEHLQNGITQSLHLIREWMVGRGCTPQALQPSRSANDKMFVLSGLAQVFIGEMPQSCNDLLRIIADKKAIDDETGSAVPHRLASPMIVRVHHCNNGFVPVLTWSPRSEHKLKIAKTFAGGNGPWLDEKMGFAQSLQGDSLYA